MALIKADLAKGIKDLTDELSKIEDKEEASTKLSEGLADLIDKYIKSATVTVDPGITVSTAGTAVSQTGATTSTGTGSLS